MANDPSLAENTSRSNAVGMFFDVLGLFRARQRAFPARSVLALTLLAACGATEQEPASTRPAPSTEPPLRTDAPPGSTTPPATSSDAGASDAGLGGPARCGAKPYAWLASPTLGQVLEKEDKAPHTQLDLLYAFVEIRNKKAFKTERLPKYSTVSSIVRYQTQDRGQLVDATALVTSPDSSKSFPILLFLHGTTGFTDQCAPSRNVADDDLGGFTSEVGILASIYASLGYVVVMPDYIGMKSMGTPSPSVHPYLIGEPTAVASLDAVRAAKALLPKAAASSVVLIGGSQGGHGAAFVGRYAPHYAPELSIKGAVWDVPPTDLAGQAQLALAPSWIKASGNMVAFLVAAEAWYGASPNGLADALLPPFLSAIPTAMMTTCSGLKGLPTPTLDTVFSTTVRSLVGPAGFGGPEPWTCYARENSLPTTSVPRLDDIPAMMLMGENDNLVSTAVERGTFQTLCAQGMRLQYRECAGAGHTEPLVYAFDETLDFLNDRLDGKPMPATTCQLSAPIKCSSTP